MCLAWSFPQTHDGFLVLNTVDPIGDAGLLSHLLDASSVLPLLVVTITVGVFLVAWVIATSLDSMAKREGAWVAWNKSRGRGARPMHSQCIAGRGNM